jgi:phosphatidylserine/phosphatidylglycerophosphate/cardiolipin synthase-like enzyme
VSLIAAAKKSLYIESLEFSNTDVENAVVARYKAGIDVKVLLADPTFSTSITSAYSFLKAEGVPGRDLVTPEVHAKMILVDGERAYFGSENMSYTSLNLNREVGLEVLTSNGEDVGALTKTFESDWARATTFSP